MSKEGLQRMMAYFQKYGPPETGDCSELLSSDLLAKLRKASSDAIDDYFKTGSEHSLGAHRAFATVLQWATQKRK